MLASEQIRALVIALGTAIGDTFDISKLRYHKSSSRLDATWTAHTFVFASDFVLSTLPTAY